MKSPYATYADNLLQATSHMQSNIRLAARHCGPDLTHELLDDSELRSDLRHIKLGLERKEITTQEAETLEKEARGRFEKRLSGGRNE